MKTRSTLRMACERIPFFSGNDFDASECGSLREVTNQHTNFDACRLSRAASRFRTRACQFHLEPESPDHLTKRNNVQKSRQIEAIYPLSPMQQGMLFHTIYDPSSGVYFHQVKCVLEGELDTASLRDAWQRVLDRHAILRTAFVWEHRKQPLQVVHRQVRLAVVAGRLARCVSVRTKRATRSLSGTGPEIRVRSFAGTANALCATANGRPRSRIHLELPPHPVGWMVPRRCCSKRS